FVPPIFDMLDPDGFFLKQEAQINLLNREIELLENAPEIPILKKEIQIAQEQIAFHLSEMRKLHKHNKASRKEIRAIQKEALSETQYLILEEDLVKQSYRDQ